MQRIEDHALLGDCHSAALVARSGAVEWACFPRFDSPAVFSGILDPERGGSFLVAPEAGQAEATRRYLDDSNVLVTRFETPQGVLELTDCMPVRRFEVDDDPGRPASAHAILRRARCLEGRVAVRAAVAPRFEYGGFVPRFTAVSPHEAAVVGGADALFVTATRPFDVTDSRVRALWRLEAGDEVWIEARWCRADQERREAPDAERFAERLDGTLAFWRGWMQGCLASGPHAELVRRSANEAPRRFAHPSRRSR